MPGEPVAQNGDSVDGAAAIEMDLQFVCSRTVVYLGFYRKVIRSEVHEQKETNIYGTRNTNKAYVSYIDRSVVCIYPLLRSHVVERPCEENKYSITTSGYSGSLFIRGWRAQIQRGEILGAASGTLLFL